MGFGLVMSFEQYALVGSTVCSVFGLDERCRENGSIVGRKYVALEDSITKIWKGK